ncbi:MAG: class I SAM-dependent methyltransferase [Patescibacteria group bacterium]
MDDPTNRGERMVPEMQRDDLIYLEHITRYLFAKQFVTQARVLDLACGAGYGSSMLASANATHVHGIDVSPEAIAYAQKRYAHERISFQVGDADAIPLETGSIDVAVSFETIEHVHHPERFVKELVRVLKENGLLILSTPHSPVAPEDNEHHLHLFTAAQLLSLLHDFPHIRTFYQNTVAASYVVEENHLKEGAYPLHTEQVSDKEPGQQQYIIVVASRHALPALQEIATLFTDRELQKGLALERTHQLRARTWQWKLLRMLYKTSNFFSSRKSG